jgi:citrate synthase
MRIHILTTDQVAARLGVKRETVYAYVSRGQLSRELAEDGRGSLFDPREVEKLARRGRPRGDAPHRGRIEVPIATSITGIVEERLYYRGLDATALAGEARFEQVAELLWTGQLPQRKRFRAPAASLQVARRACARLPRESPSAERFAVACAALACEHPMRVDLRSERVREYAELLLRAFAIVLPRRGDRPSPASGRPRKAASPSLAETLWPRLSPLKTSTARTRLLDAALVLLADHELATSTLAARVAASTRADPFGVVLAGLGAVSGPLHGKAALSVHRLLHDASRAATPHHAVAETLSRSSPLPGWGHPVYRAGDPRAARLLELLRAVASRKPMRLISEVRRAAEGAHPGAPCVNVDFALGALAYAMRMPVGSTEAIFAIARTAGWIAHALEEYGERPLRFRARALYDGMGVAARTPPG